MKNLSEKTLSRLLFLSLFINVLCFGYGLKEVIKTGKAESVEVNTSQPDKVTYYIGRNEVFEKLPNTPNEIIMVGNSLTHNFEWHEMFRDVNIINRGIGSDISKGILQRLDEIIESKPSKIFIMIGINDIARDYQIDSIYKNYLQILYRIKLDSPQTKVYIQSVLPCKKQWNSKIIILNKMLNEYCRQNNLPFIDLYSKFVINEELNPMYDCGDKVHLNGDGYQLWCNSIRNFVYE